MRLFAALGLVMLALSGCAVFAQSAATPYPSLAPTPTLSIFDLIRRANPGTPTPTRAIRATQTPQPVATYQGPALLYLFVVAYGYFFIAAAVGIPLWAGYRGKWNTLVCAVIVYLLFLSYLWLVVVTEAERVEGPLPCTPVGTLISTWAFVSLGRRWKRRVIERKAKKEGGDRGEDTATR